MAKRKKTAPKAAATRRTNRRGNQGASTSSATEGETSTPVEQTTEVINIKSPKADNTENTNTQPESLETSEELAITKPNQVPVIALHKKFGKYRCLFSSDEAYIRKYEVGSDSETNSSIEVKVVDPCASSESDSNAAPDLQIDVNSRNCISPTDGTINTMTTNSRDIELTLQMLHEPTENVQLPLLNDLNIINDRVLQSPSLLDELSKSPEDLNMDHLIIDNNEKSTLEQQGTEIAEIEQIICNTENIDVQDNPAQDDLIEYVDDEEIITVVQIVEDDHSDLYYDIKIDSPQPQIHENFEVKKPQDSDLQKHFENLNLMTDPEAKLSMMDCNEIIDITTPPCRTPDLTFSKEIINEGLMRPDPSLTPSSTLSDDSNSSRIVDQNQNNSNDSSESSPTGVRRSSRIKTISSLKQKTKGYGLVKTPLKKALITQTKLKLEELGSDSQEKSDNNLSSAPNSPSFPIPSEMPVKVKSRWRRSSELEMGANSPASSPLASPNLPSKLPPVNEIINVSEEEQLTMPLSKEAYDKIIEERMNQYQHLEENEYLCDRMISKETKKMICDCFMTKEELERGELACGEDCLNRLLMIECNSRCPVGDRCTNRRFQKRENAKLKVFYANKKGCGVDAAADITSGEFLLEYVGEVLDYEQFYKRAQVYSEENNLHHYFMSLKGDTVIDATLKGNISRFINHSCDPNAETQKWTVNGELRIGFFSKRDIVAGEELTFDYQFQRFGKVAQRCYCGADTCRGWIGGEPDSDDEDDDEEEEDVSTSKSGAEELSEQANALITEQPQQRPRKPKKERKYKPKAPDLVQDADIEEDLEVLNRTGVKNQSHTLRLSRTVVRAKSRRAQVALLRLLRDADLPCRRLFLDYRGLRLLAPWCADALLDFKLEMLQTVDRLPIPNKTMVQESRFFTIVERWLSSAEVPIDNVFIDESTGLPVDLPKQDNAISPEKLKENALMTDKIKDLCNQLLDRWSGLKEVFKIPKKERLQQMKEHERQANVERRAADSSGTRDRDTTRDRDSNRERERREEREREREREREKERERERERDRDREKDRYRDRERDRDRDDRDRRKRRGSPEGRRSIRLSERVLAAIPPMSKEERRRAFAEAAAVADETRRHRDHALAHPHARPHSQRPPHWPHYWPRSQHEHYPQMFPGMVPGCVSDVGPVGPVGPMGPEWVGPEFGPPPGFCPPFPGPQQFCMPQPNLISMGGFGMGGFMFGQQMPPATASTPFPPRAHPHLPPQQDNAQQGSGTGAVPGTSGASGEGREASVAVGGAQSTQAQDVVLPSMWRSAQDQRGRTYYYHVKRRQPQWLPPPPPDNQTDESSTEEEEEQVSTLDSPLMRHQLKGKLVEGVNGIYEVIKKDPRNGLIPDHALVNVKPRKRRAGLVSERPISPRTEEDKLAGRLEVKRYKQTKEKLRKRREKLLQKVRLLSSNKLKLQGLQEKLTNFVDLVDSDSELEDELEENEAPIIPIELPPPLVVSEIPLPSPPTSPPRAPSPDPQSAPVMTTAEMLETARRIKEQFRSAMASVMVHHLNPYRHSDAPAGRITCTADFKHLARKLTHFVMLKELKHCRDVEELVVTDSVRSKAKTFVRKYMAKFGPVYKRPPEEVD